VNEPQSNGLVIDTINKFPRQAASKSNSNLSQEVANIAFDWHGH